MVTREGLLQPDREGGQCDLKAHAFFGVFRDTTQPNSSVLVGITRDKLHLRGFRLNIRKNLLLGRILQQLLPQDTVRSPFYSRLNKIEVQFDKS